MKKYIKNYILQAIIILGISVYIPVALAQEKNAKEDNGNANKITLNDDEESDVEEDGDNEVDDNKGNKEGDDDSDLEENDVDENDDSDVEENDVDENDDSDVEENDVDENDDADDADTEDGEDNLKGEEHRSIVAATVLKLLEIADKEKGSIGEQIKVIAQEQNQEKEVIATEIDEIQNRSKVKTFFIGTDYKNTGKLRSDMVKTSNNIDKLNELLTQTADTESKTALEEQVKTLEKQQQKIGNLLEENESKFSLFGWFVKLFVK